ncbi:MAG: hypothetical protein KDD42_05285, partial [Bdellovibrionales bacterium]|nr:hypothetical protein [Bdellovibrionales bacterium]
MILLLRPQILAIKRHIFGAKHRSGERARDIVIAIFALTIMLGIHSGTVWSLKQIHMNPELVFLPPAQPLALVLMLLLLMLLISNTVSALGHLYLGQDLDLVLAAPLSFKQFFFSKFAAIMLSSSWMSLVFIIPLITGFGLHFGAHGGFLAVSFLLLLPYFALPSALSMVIATLLIRFVPAKLSQLISLAIGALFLSFAFLLAAVIRAGFLSESSDHLLKVLTMISTANDPHLPSYWVSSAIQEMLVPSGIGWKLQLILLYSSATALLALAYIVLRSMHRSCFTRAKSGYIANKKSSRLWKRNGIIVRLLGQPRRALIARELTVFFRDLSQLVQVLILLSITVVYLFNLRFFANDSSFPGSQGFWWRNFFFASNWAISAFIATGICTRFVYPSFSLEGRSFWILITAPLELKQIFKAKFALWFPPIAAVLALILSVGAFAAGFPPHLVIINGICGIIMSYGIVNLALGLGARFSRFDWEHSGQLAASFGSMVFMLISVMHIFMNMAPLWI